MVVLNAGDQVSSTSRLPGSLSCECAAAIRGSILQPPSSALRFILRLRPSPQPIRQYRLVHTKQGRNKQHEERQTGARNASELELLGERQRIAVQQSRRQQRQAQRVQHVDRKAAQLQY